MKCLTIQLRYSHAASTRACVHPAACSSLDCGDQTLSRTLRCIRNSMFPPKHLFICCASPQINPRPPQIVFLFLALRACPCWVGAMQMQGSAWRRGHSASCIHHNLLAVLRENVKLRMHSKAARKRQNHLVLLMLTWLTYAS